MLFMNFIRVVYRFYVWCLNGLAHIIQKTYPYYLLLLHRPFGKLVHIIRKLIYIFIAFVYAA